MSSVRVYWVEYKANGVRQRVEERGFANALTYAEWVYRNEACPVWIRKPGSAKRVKVAG